MNDSSALDLERDLLRHALATLAYRAAKVLRNATEVFCGCQADHGLRTPGQILAHMGDLMDWALSMAIGKQEWHDSKPLAWDQEIERFFGALKALDDFLASTEPVHAPLEKLFQGPIADALTHVGQIAMLRRLAGEPLKGENYYIADIKVGRVGVSQTKPRKEF